MSSELDIGDVEKESFNSEITSKSKSNKKSSSSSSDDSEGNSNEKEKEKENESDDDESSQKNKKESKGNSDDENESEDNNNETKKKNSKENSNKKVKENEDKDEEEEEKNSNMKKNKSKKLKDIKLKKDNKQKNSKSKSNKTSTKNQENNLIIEKSSSTRTQKESKNKFYIQRDNKRLETLMNVLTESSSSESEVKVNKFDERIKKEREIIKKENEARIKFQKFGGVQFQIKGIPKYVDNIMKNEELNLQREKIRYLEEKNLKLDCMNQMYYDMLKSANIEIIKNNSNNNNDLKFQSLDCLNNNIPNISNNLNEQNPENLDFMIQNYIDGERNKNIHNFNDSMIDINQKITNYLIDTCQEQKEKNKRLEDFKDEIGQKLDKIVNIQKKQKSDIDFIIKYGLNKNKALDPIIGLLLDYKRPLPNLLKDIAEENKYEKVFNEKNFVPFKNFSLYGRYSNQKNENDNNIKKDKGGIFKRTGSCIFENRSNPFNYKLKENEEYHKYNPDIKRPFFENRENGSKKEVIGDKKCDNDDKYEEEEFQKFVAYKGRFFIPKDFRFGGVEGKKKKINKQKKYKKDIEEFII